MTNFTRKCEEKVVGTGKMQKSLEAKWKGGKLFEKLPQCDAKEKRTEELEELQEKIESAVVRSFVILMLFCEFHH